MPANGSNSEVRACSSAVRFTLKKRHHKPGLPRSKCSCELGQACGDGLGAT
jgi:hypothetical protein